jgi:hypothetical protein
MRKSEALPTRESSCYDDSLTRKMRLSRSRFLRMMCSNARLFRDALHLGTRVHSSCSTLALAPALAFASWEPTQGSRNFSTCGRISGTARMAAPMLQRTPTPSRGFFRTCPTHLVLRRQFYRSIL